MWAVLIFNNFEIHRALLRIRMCVCVYIRARWNWFKKIKLLKIKTGHMYSYVKLNFKASLFSCIFWFEAIYLDSWAFLVFWPYSWENGTKRVQKIEFSKIGSKSTQKWWISPSNQCFWIFSWVLGRFSFFCFLKHFCCRF